MSKGNGRLRTVQPGKPGPKDQRNHPCRQQEMAEAAQRDCCWHRGGDPLPQTIKMNDQLYRIRVQTQACCWHGGTRLVYDGVADAGHGPFVGFVDEAHRSEPVPLGRTARGLVLQ